jgi:prolyl 4-hydroxylase
MFYLETPEKGGHTVFPRIGAKVRSLRKTAVFWYNLHASGENDWRTLHVYFFLLFLFFKLNES